MIRFTSKDVEEELRRRSQVKKKNPVIRRVYSKKVIDDSQSKALERVKKEVKEHSDKNSLLRELEEKASQIFKTRAKLSSSIYKAVKGHAAISPIDIGSVLMKIDEYIDQFGNVKSFGLRYLKHPGVEGEMLDCRKNVKDPKRARTGNKDKRAKSEFSLKERGVIRMHNDEKGFRDITVACIFEFKDHKSNRWVPVKH